ncbi:MAG: polyhydroxyalkanoate synthesis repressor PhaR [Alphaproteobacteria bacterium]|nr:polyhydroxyalkanoate synthesis repressor PhaR [Alphaproteobacteria bacterium]
MRIIKKYPNRRLYDTERSSYIKLAEVHELIREGVEFQVVDADSCEDIPRSILLQIIIEQENGENPIFTKDMLTKFIRFYEDGAHTVFGDFLEKNLEFFQQQMNSVMDNPLPKMVQDMTQRNFALWQDMQQQFFKMTMGAGAQDGDVRKDKKAGE